MNVINAIRKKFNDNEINPDRRAADLNKVIELADYTRERTQNWNMAEFEKKKAMAKEQQEKTLESADANAIRMEEQENNREQMHSDTVADPLKSDDFTIE